MRYSINQCLCPLSRSVLKSGINYCVIASYMLICIVSWICIFFNYHHDNY
ncbi:unnamed protein product [Brassica napus]|uniref:(rape) hypothetical protein n=1 Tax=Brassica napus TaxID=3708 RepID=A0A816K3M4_BRANA|nr:unnamed protein product [Brassica napus]